MARPIVLEMPVRDARKELISRLEQAPAEHAEALLDAFELLQQLHDRQVFEVLRGALAAGDKLVETATDAAANPASVTAFRNLVILGKTLASIDPTLLRCLSGAVQETMAAAPETEPPGILSLLKSFRQINVRRSLAFLPRFLNAWGSRMKANQVSREN